jgi:hypothetical protein
LTFDQQDAVEPPAAPADAKPESASRMPPEGRPTKRRGFGAIRVAALDPSIRSRMVVEDSTNWIVVNSRYPLFIERGGDVLYQVETAVRELCRAVEGLTVAEYEKRIEELLDTVFKLRRTRRRRQSVGHQLRMPRG